MMKKMLDVYPNWLIGQGIFKDLEEFDVPWKSQFNSSPLDLNYYGNHSGEKFISPLVDKILGDDTALSEAARHSIASAVYTMNIENWKKLWDALHEEYVNMIEAGIVDPAKVTGSALQNATSVASTLLTTESVVAAIKEPEPAAPAGGMGGMM